MAGADETGAGSAAQAGAAGAPVAHTRWGVVAVTIFASVFVGYAVGKVPPTIGLISDEFALDRVTAGWLASIFFAFGAGFGVLTGMTGARVGARALLLTGTLVLVLSGVAGALATSAAMLLAVRVFEGISFAAIVSSAPKITFDATRPGDRNLALGIWSGYMPGGMALAMVVAPFLAESLGWRSLWWLCAGAALAGGGARGGRHDTPALARAAEPRRGRRFRLGRGKGDGAGRRLVALRRGVPALHRSMVRGRRLAAHLPDRDARPRAHRRRALLGAGGGHERHRQPCTGGWLMQKRVPRFVLVGAANVIMAVTGMLILAGFVPDDAKIPLAIVFSAGSGVLPAAAYGGAATHAPKPQLVAMANGFMVQGAAIGMLLGPPLMAVVVGGFGSWESAWWCMLICPAAGLVIAARLFTIERR